MRNGTWSRLCFIPGSEIFPILAQFAHFKMVQRYTEIILVVDYWNNVDVKYNRCSCQNKPYTVIRLTTFC